MADIYVDFSAANDGDGTTHTQAASGGAAGAYNTFIGKTFSSGDKVWIRRQNRAGQTANVTSWTAGAHYIGWPISGDPFYASRPAGAQAAWDGDSDTHAQVTFTNGTGMSVSNAVASIHRLKSHCTGTSATCSNWTFGHGTTQIELWNLDAEHTGTSAVLKNNYAINGRVYMVQCVGRAARGESSKSGSLIGYSFVFGNANATASTLTKCTATWSTGLSLSGGLFTGSGTMRQCVVMDFTVSGNPTYGLHFSNSNGIVRFIGGEINAQTAISWAAAGTASLYIVQSIKFTNCDSYVVTTTGTSSMSMIHVREATQDSAVTAAFDMDSGFLHWLWLDEKVSFHASNTDDITTNSLVPCFVYTRGKAEITNRGTTNDFVPGQWGSDFADAMGEWAIRSDTATIDGNPDVTRDGGGLSSIKIAPSSTKGVRGASLHLGMTNQDIHYIPLSAGSQTITLYGAYKGYTTAPNKLDVWFEFDYSDETPGSSRAWANTREVADLESDASTWTGVSGETAFKISKTVTVGQDCIARVRIGAGKYESGAELYIDPTLVVS